MPRLPEVGVGVGDLEPDAVPEPGRCRVGARVHDRGVVAVDPEHAQLGYAEASATPDQPTPQPRSTAEAPSRASSAATSGIAGTHSWVSWSRKAPRLNKPWPRRTSSPYSPKLIPSPVR